MPKTKRKSRTARPPRQGFSRKTTPVYVRMPNPVLAKIDAGAKKEHRTRSAQIVTLLEQAVR